MITVLIYIAYK